MLNYKNHTFLLTKKTILLKKSLGDNKSGFYERQLYRIIGLHSKSAEEEPHCTSMKDCKKYINDRIKKSRPLKNNY